MGFRLFVFVLAMFVYSLFLFIKGEVSREDFRFFLILVFMIEVIDEFLSRYIKIIEPFINNLDLFLRG
ncbi:MAG: hypothetical protein MjAS7_2532 [Metallosphaera javensis (ex Sakai et al. 2022)]|nr:MAG: hypothetical protein MjAS7_2532 [Metallosphaera javensis (ex Sakai et al. 2022)]